MGYGRPTVERRQLGLMLKKLRERKGVSQNDAAAAIGRKQARISRAEIGVGSLAQDELAELLNFYGVPEEEQATALALGAQARKRQRGRAYADQLPHAFERLTDLQADARSIGFYETGIVPGLAQSPDYVRALMRAGDGAWWNSDSEEAERRIAYRLNQQNRVLGSDMPKSVVFVLTETSLHQIVGSVAVLRGQILHLLQLNERPDISVQVVPSECPDNPLLGGGLITLDFDGVAPRIAFSASHGPATYHDREEDTEPMFQAFDRVRQLALTPEETGDLLLARLKDMSR
ncbi:helix-turn-helix transcriptional regulator [Saccharopolyspora sp. NPDC002686]|uniref:helix-turn-helix domain-containing protein n=1 Tax=Saccharopolyspora sp. NPDC002686 TaxID=3154541 RepID=UPI0033247E26